MTSHTAGHFCLWLFWQIQVPFKIEKAQIHVQCGIFQLKNLEFKWKSFHTRIGWFVVGWYEPYSAVWSCIRSWRYVTTAHPHWDTFALTQSASLSQSSRSSGEICWQGREIVHFMYLVRFMYLDSIFFIYYHKKSIKLLPAVNHEIKDGRFFYILVYNDKTGSNRRDFFFTQ